MLTTWDILRHCIKRSWFPGSKTWDAANHLAAKLLGKALEEISAGECPDPKLAGQREAKGDQPRVSFPETISDYRAVIVGQMPSTKLHPVVMVKPADGRDYWYPQHVGKHNPIVVGSAFSCLALFGDPHVRGYRKPEDDDVQEFLVRVYALASPWNGGSDRFRDKDLTERLKPYGPEYISAFTINRDVPTASSVKIEDRVGVQWEADESKEIVACKAPVGISWVGTPATVEVRQSEGDRFVDEQSGTSPVILSIGGRKPVGRAAKHKIVLRKAGLYRVRLHPRKPTFIAPLFEWWIKIADTLEVGTDAGQRAIPISEKAGHPTMHADASEGSE